VATKQGNHCTDLIKRKVMKNMEIKMVCEDCERAGITSECRHMEHLRPNWQSEENSEFTKLLYGMDNEDDFARESQGIDKQPPTACFEAHDINHVFTTKKHRLTETQRYIFIAIDPCAGTTKSGTAVSEFAWVTFVEPGFRIIGLESIPTRGFSSWEGRLIQHIKFCYAQPYLMNAKLVVFVESNMKGEAEQVQRVIRQHYPFSAFPNDKKDLIPGIITTNKTKHDMQLAFRAALEERVVSLPENLITTDDNPVKLLTRLQEQLMEFQKIANVGKTPLSQTQHVFSGKGLNNKKMDDLAIVVQLGHYCMRRFFTSPDWMIYQR
jgi:hypothetical protein